MRKPSKHRDFPSLLIGALALFILRSPATCSSLLPCHRRCSQLSIPLHSAVGSPALLFLFCAVASPMFKSRDSPIGPRPIGLSYSYLLVPSSKEDYHRSHIITFHHSTTNIAPKFILLHSDCSSRVGLQFDAFVIGFDKKIMVPIPSQVSKNDLSARRIIPHTYTIIVLTTAQNDESLLSHSKMSSEFLLEQYWWSGSGFGRET